MLRDMDSTCLMQCMMVLTAGCGAGTTSVSVVFKYLPILYLCHIQRGSEYV